MLGRRRKDPQADLRAKQAAELAAEERFRAARLPKLPPPVRRKPKLATGADEVHVDLSEIVRLRRAQQRILDDEERARSKQLEAQLAARTSHGKAPAAPVDAGR